MRELTEEQVVFLKRVNDEIAGTAGMLLEETRGKPELVLCLATELHRQAAILIKAFYVGDELKSKMHLIELSKL